MSLTTCLAERSGPFRVHTRPCLAASSLTHRVSYPTVRGRCLLTRGIAPSEMPPQALALAFAASIYPPAVAVVIALGRGSQVRSRVLAFVMAAAIVTYATGVLTLFVLSDVGATGLHYTPSAAVNMALGLLLLGLAARLHRPRASSAKSGEGSKMERRLQSRRLAFVLGLTLYALPSPIYIGAVKAIADAKLSTSSPAAGSGGDIGGDAVADRATNAFAAGRTRARVECA